LVASPHCVVGMPKSGQVNGGGSADLGVRRHACRHGVRRMWRRRERHRRHPVAP